MLRYHRTLARSRGRADQSLGFTIGVTDGSGWITYGEFFDIDGRLTLVKLLIEPYVEGRPLVPFVPLSSTEDLTEEHKDGITAVVARSAALTELYAALPQVVNKYADSGAASAQGTIMREAAKRWKGSKLKPGRAGRGDGYYALWAARYVDNLGVRSPIATTAKKYKKTSAQVRDLIHEARRRELLSKAGKGRAGGTLTEKGREALARGGGQT